MITLDLQGSKEAERLLQLAPKEVYRAGAAAINRTITKAKTKVSVAVRREYIAKAADIKAAIAIKRASSGNLRGEINITGEPLQLTKFKVTQPKRGPMKAKVLKKSSLKPVKGLFVVPNRGYLAHRTQKERFPLKSPYGPSIPQMAGRESVSGEITDFAEDFFQTRFQHEIEFRLGGLL